MKKFKFSGLFILCLCVFSNQFVFADIVLKKDDPGTGTLPLSPAMSSMTKFKTSSSTITSSYIAVTADVVGTELIVDFGATVGTAYVSIVAESGNVVYSTVV